MARDTDRLGGWIDNPYRKKKVNKLDMSGMYYIGDPGDSNRAPFKTYGETFEIALERYRIKRESFLPKSTGTVVPKRADNDEG